MKNDLELEGLIRNTLSFGDLGQCAECKGAFLPEDRVVCVVRNTKPRHYECWEKMGKPYRKPWGNDYGNPEYSVHIRKAASVEYVGSVPKRYRLSGPYKDGGLYNTLESLYALAGDKSHPQDALCDLEDELESEEEHLKELPLIRHCLEPDFMERLQKAYNLRKKLIEDSRALQAKYGSK